MHYQLITTGLLKEIENGNEKIFLLSSWCNTPEMEKKLEKRIFETIPYHWRNKEKFNSDFNYLSN